MADELPRLAILGHPNAGKSSVVATLTENDRIAIDQRAGTTTESDRYPVVIDGRTVIEFVDTPGFQNPAAILEWFRAHPDTPDLARAFVDSNRDDPLLAHDRSLLEPVAEGAGIILVVDGSKRIKEKDRIEIELLRLTARPRMAILNNLTERAGHMAQWQVELAKAFNSVRDFNAHRATYAERIRLLQALRSIDQRWEPRLDLTVEAFERDWDRRMDQAVQTVLDLMKEALALKVHKDVKSAAVVFRSGRERIETELMGELAQGLRRLETQARGRIRANFRHNVWDLPPSSILEKDLLGEEVSQALGLSRRQLALTGAAAGAASGVGIDLALAGHSLGAGALLGAAAGGLLGVFGGRALARLDLERRPGTMRFVAGPVSNPRLPFVLLDRICLYAAHAMNWAHGRQAADEQAPDRVPDRPLPRLGLAERLDAEAHRELARFFAAARRGRQPDREEACRTIVKGILKAIAEDRADRA
jgi:GTPase Era involved in 16S rRNA processing